MVVYGGVGVESNRPATNSPGIPVDSNRVNRLVEKNGLVVGPRQLESPMKQGGFSEAIFSIPPAAGLQSSKPFRMHWLVEGLLSRHGDVLLSVIPPEAPRE